MITLRAIETVYKGYRFRSRLEARWAVFFDAMGIDWSYEPEGFELSDGSRYLPDFCLHERVRSDYIQDTYAEVKPFGGDFTKAIRLADDIDRPILLLEGEPAPHFYTRHHRNEDHTIIFVRKITDGEFGSSIREDEELSIGLEYIFVLAGLEGTMSAIRTSRAARFGTLSWRCHK
jgi:hypothetical protein